MRLGKNMKHALSFLQRCAGWITYAEDRPTVQAIYRLEVLGLVETNKFHQVRLSTKFILWPCNVCKTQSSDCDIDKQHFPCFVE